MSEAVVPELLTQTIGAPARDDRAYVTITHTENFGIEYFNGIERATRDVTVSGVHLVFDTTAGDGLLKSTVSQPDGRPCEDIRRFNVYADSVVVRSLIHLPATHVLVQARELRFEDQGAIMTTPIDLGVPDDEPQLQDGLPIRGAPGHSGEPAGNITLNVGSVVVPTSELLAAPLTLGGMLTDASWRLSGGAGGVRFKIAPANSAGSGFAPDQEVRILLIPEKPASGLKTYIFGFRADEGNPGTAWITHTASQNPLGLAPRAAGKDTSAVPDPEGVNRSFAWPKSGALSGWIYFDSGYAAIGAGDRFLESKLAEWRDAGLTRGAFRVRLAQTGAHAPLVLSEFGVVPARLLLQGGAGQPGGPGGLKQYRATEDEAPSRDLAPVSCADVQRRVANALAQRGDIGSARVASADKVAFYDAGQDTLAAEFKAGRVVYAQFSRFRFADQRWHPRESGGFVMPAGGKKLRPQSGRDAYPAGAPGKGGSGGVLTASCSLPHVLASVGGGPGGISPAVSGEEAGKPRDAVWITNCEVVVYLRKKEAQGRVVVEARLVHPAVAHEGATPRDKYLGKAIQDVHPADGKSCNAQRGERGAPGRVDARARAAGIWLHPLNVMPVIEYARDAFQSGDRKSAAATLTALRDAISAAKEVQESVAGEVVTIDSLLARLKNNLDAFGHPPGWVPRLGIAATVPIFKKVVESAYEVMYAAYRLQWAYQEKMDARRFLGHAVETLNTNTDRAKSEILEAQAQLPRLKQELERIKGEIDVLQQKFTNFKNELEEEAKKNVDETKAEIAAFKGIFKLMSAACYIFPVGQPYVGAVGGNLFELISTARDDEQDVLKIAASYTKATTEFFGDEKTQSKLLDDLTKREQGTLSNIQKELGDITKNETEIKANQDVLNKDIEALVAKQKAGLASELEALLKDKASFQRFEAYGQLGSDEQRASFIHGHALDLVIDDVQKRIAAIDGKPASAAFKAEKKALDDFERKLRSLSTRQNNLNKLKEETDKRLGDRKQAIEKALATAQNVGNGVSKGIEAIQTLCMDTTATETEIARELQKLVEGKYRKEWTARTRQLAAELEALNRRKQTFLGNIEKYQASIGVNAETMHSNLRKVDGMSRCALNLSGTLDPMVARFAADLGRRARQGILEWRYIFAKAWEYQFVTPISADVYELQSVESKLEEFMKTDAEGKKVKLEQDDFKALRDLTMAPLRERAKAVLASYTSDSRGLEVISYAIRGSELLGADGIDQLNRTVIPASEIARLKSKKFPDEDVAAFHNRVLTLEQINKLDGLDVEWEYGAVTFDFPSRGFGRRDWELFRIVTLKLSDLDVEWLAPPGDAQQKIRANLELEFAHSGLSVIRYQGKNYAFRDQSPDAAITWRFVYRQDGDQGETQTPSAVSWDRQVLTQLGFDESEASTFANFAEYRPGATAPITVRRRRVGRSTVALIKDFALECTFEASIPRA